MTLLPGPPHHIAKRGGKDVVIETRAIHVEKYGMGLDHFQRNIKIALEDEDVAADDVQIVFEVEVEYDDTTNLKCSLTWYRPATADDKRENREWTSKYQDERDAAERERLKQVVARNPTLVRNLLDEVDG